MHFINNKLFFVTKLIVHIGFIRLNQYKVFEWITNVINKYFAFMILYHCNYSYNSQYPILCRNFVQSTKLNIVFKTTYYYY